MVSDGHPEHDILFVGRSTSKTVKSTMWIAISFVARRSLCYMKFHQRGIKDEVSKKKVTTYFKTLEFSNKEVFL